MKFDDYFSSSKWNWLVSYIKDIDRHNSPLPFTLRLDLTVDCNFGCPYCLYQSQASTIQKDSKYVYPASSKLDDLRLIKLIRLFAKRGLKSAIITGGGEPFVYPKLEKILDVLFRYKIEVGIITNGTKLNSGFIEKYSSNQYLKWIRISLDATCERTWQLMHKPHDHSSFAETIANIELLTGNKDRNFLVGINFLVTPINYREIISAYDLTKKLDADNIRYTPVFTKIGRKIYQGIKPEIDNQFAQVMGLNNPRVQINLPRFDFMDKPNSTERCWFSAFSINLGVDSNLYPCCLKKYVKGMGTPLSPESFDEDLKRYFKKMKRFKALSCQDCMYQKFNEFAQAASLNGHLDHFIP
ncbi:MAG: radical SAM protein [Patescibacteria group bacterium]|jgi:MoaA/NifB/PqqE/SkfB family radical SAM enzyme